MLVVDKYRCTRQVGWSDAAEVHAGPLDPTHKVPVAVKIRHGLGGPPRPGGNRDRFLRAANDQQAAVLAGCKFIAPIFDMGGEEDNAFFVTRHFQRSIDSLIQGRVSVDAAGLHRLTAGTLAALEELRDRQQRAHGNLKPTNIFLDGKTMASANAILGDLGLREESDSQGADCYAFGEIIVQLIRGRTVRNFDWPIIHTDDWERLGPLGHAWREFTNVLMSPDLGKNPDALAEARKAFKNMRKLGATASKAGGTAAGTTGGETTYRAPRPKSKGLLAGIGTVVAAAVAYVALLFQPPNSKGMVQLRSALPFLVYVLPRVPLPKVQPVAPTPEPEATPVMAAETPPPTPEPTATPALVQATPTPAPTAVPTVDPEQGKWIGYASVLDKFKASLNEPNASEQSELLSSALLRFKDGVQYNRLLSNDTTVTAFVQQLPRKLEATGDQPDLPADRWAKVSQLRQEDVMTATYEWNHTGVRMQFNRVAAPGGSGPAYYLSATTVPLRFGALLAKVAEADGKGPLSGASSPRGPVSWQYVGGQYGPRSSWMVLDNVNGPLYSDKGAPTADHPMNGLSGIDAARLAKAAGCTLPSLAQWSAVLASPAGQEWERLWQTEGRVRNAQWSQFAKKAQASIVANTGTKLPNDQCFGDKANLDAAGQGGDANLFFDPVGSKSVKQFAHLIGNVGQYVVDNPQAPTKYYFAGGSAESAPSVFQSLPAPALVPTAFLGFADAGFRVAIPAKGSGSEKNPALDKLKVDLEKEIARVQKLQ